MTVPTSVDPILVALSNGNCELIPFYKDGRIGGSTGQAPVQGRIQSWWTFNGTPGGAGSAPGGTAVYPTNATAGAMGQTDPGGGRQKFLVGGYVLLQQESTTNNVAGKVTIYDRLAHISGFSGTNTGVITVNMNALTRYNSNATCVGNVLAWEVYTQIGITARTITCSYTNENGTSGQTTQAAAIGGTSFREVAGMGLIPLASGDRGIQAVASCQLSGSTGTAGDWGLTLMRPLMEIQVSAVGTCHVRNLLEHPEGLANSEVLAGACLAAYYSCMIAGGTTQLDSILQFVEA